MSSLLYGAMTVINIFLPSIWFALYIVMSMKFAGFPPSSKVAIDRLYILTKLGIFGCQISIELVLIITSAGSVWTVTRLAWGAISLTEVTDKWLFGNRTSPLLLSVELVSVFDFGNGSMLMFHDKSLNFCEFIAACIFYCGNNSNMAELAHGIFASSCSTRLR